MGAFEEGDWTTPTLTVTPFDGTTIVSLAVVSPSNVVTAPAVTGAAGVYTATAYEFTVPGEWIERWTVTGTGKGKERRVNLIAPDPGNVPSGTRVYATTADYANWLRTAPPSGARRALAEASREVEQMLLSAFYTVDAVTKLPTDTDVIAAMRDATCAQAEYAKAIGDVNSLGSNQYHSVSIATVSLTRGYNPGGSSAPAKWSAKAFEILQRAGLTGHDAYTW